MGCIAGRPPGNPVGIPATNTDRHRQHRPAPGNGEPNRHQGTGNPTSTREPGHPAGAEGSHTGPQTRSGAPESDTPRDPVRE